MEGQQIGLVLFALVFGSSVCGSLPPLTEQLCARHSDREILQETAFRGRHCWHPCQAGFVESGRAAGTGRHPAAPRGNGGGGVIALKTMEARLIAERDGLDAVDYPSSLSQADTEFAEKSAHRANTARKTAMMDELTF